MKTRSFEDLRQEVWERGTCSGCGACVAVCPADAICFDRTGGSLVPRNIGYCKLATDEVACGACYDACPRTSEKPDEILGPHLGILSARAAMDVPRRQSGGAVTAIVAAALDRGLIDAVVTVSEDRWSLRPISTVITESGELVRQAGSRYNWWVPLVSALKTAVIERKFQHIAVIGVPCVAQAVHAIRGSSNDLLKPFGAKIRLVVGLFCTETFDYRVVAEDILSRQHRIDTWQVERLDVRKGLHITLKDGSAVVIPLSELEQAVRPGCRHCRDFTAVCADVSAGAIGSPPGHTTLIIRSPAGKAFVNDAISSGALLAGGEVDIAAIEKLGRVKAARAKD